MENDVDDQDLIQRAGTVAQWAYVPYSNYPVGAALLTASGKIYDGVNVENASYAATICAERSAIVQAVSQGERQFVAIAIVTRNGGTPCGICRQVLAEFGLDTRVLIGDLEGNIIQTATVAELLPAAFQSDRLEE